MKPTRPLKLYPVPYPHHFSHCRSQQCRKRIVWGETDKEKSVQLSVDHPEAKWDGARCVVAPSHFVDCPDASGFSKKTVLAAAFWLGGLASSCGYTVVTRVEIHDERREAATAFLVSYVAAANPKSDEEPEDYMAEAWREALELYGEPVPVVWDIYGQRAVGQADQVPAVILDQLDVDDRARVDLWLACRK